MLEQVLIYIASLASLPPIINLISNLVAYRKNKKLMQGVRDEIVSVKQFNELKAELKLAHLENRENRKLIKELLIKMDRVDRKDEEPKN